jgi:hypothetical protein
MNQPYPSIGGFRGRKSQSMTVPSIAQDADNEYAMIDATAIPNSNGNLRYRRYLAFMVSREISLISDVFCNSSSNLSLLESQQPANKLDQSLNRALR